MKQSPHILSTVILSLYFLTKTLTQNENQKSLPLKEFTVCLSLVLKSQICTSDHHFSLYRGNPNTHTTFKGFPSPLRYNQIAWQDIKTSMICLLLKLWHPAWNMPLPKHQQCHSHWSFPSESSPLHTLPLLSGTSFLTPLSGQESSFKMHFKFHISQEAFPEYSSQ